MEKKETDYGGTSSVPVGGLAEVTAENSGEGRRTVRLGDTRLLDIVGSGANKILIYKGRKRDPVRADPNDVLRVLKRLISEPEKN